MILSAHGLSKTYGATPALIDAEFAIDAGEVARPTRGCCSPTSPSVSGDERDVFLVGGHARVRATTWTIPAGAKEVLTRTDPTGAVSPRIDVEDLRRTRTDAQFAQLRRAMLI